MQRVHQGSYTWVRITDESGIVATVIAAERDVPCRIDNRIDEFRLGDVGSKQCHNKLFRLQASIDGGETQAQGEFGHICLRDAHNRRSGFAYDDLHARTHAYT